MGDWGRHSITLGIKYTQHCNHLEINVRSYPELFIQYMRRSEYLSSNVYVLCILSSEAMMCAKVWIEQNITKSKFNIKSSSFPSYVSLQRAEDEGGTHETGQSSDDM